MEHSSQSYLIPMKMLELGNFSTNDIDALRVTQDLMVFEFKGQTGSETVELLRSDISKIDPHFNGEKENYIRIILHPQKANEISQKVPKGFKFVFHNAKESSNAFKLHFHDDLESNWKQFLSDFYSNNKNNCEKPVNMEVDDEPEDQCVVVIKTKGENLDGISENGPPANKKKKVEPPESTRTLRSRTQPKPQKKFDAADYYFDDDDSIPDELKQAIDEKPPRPASPSPFDRFEDTIELLTYQTFFGSEIIIRMEDYKCLDRRELISDVVIDFYLQYLFKEVFPEDLRSRVHIYSTHFYRYLSTESNFAGWKDKEMKLMSAAEKRYRRVCDFPCNKQVNIFEKDFVVFPCIKNEHWYLAIACFPSLNGIRAMDNDELLPDDQLFKDPDNASFGRPAKVPCILVFDSVKTDPGKKMAAMTHIRNFLVWERKVKYGEELDATRIKAVGPKCPQQSNATDCGLYVIQMFEHFFLHSPLTDFRFPIDMRDCYDPQIIFEKREQIAIVIKELMKKESLDGELIEMPDISFYKDDEEVQIVESETQIVNQNGNNNGCDNNNQEEFNNNNDFYAVDNNNIASNDISNNNNNGNNGFHPEPTNNESEQEQPKPDEVPLGGETVANYDESSVSNDIGYPCESPEAYGESKSPAENGNALEPTEEDGAVIVID